MWLPHLMPSGEMLVEMILCGTAIWCWRRTQRPGFLLIGMGFFLLLLLPLIYWLLLPNGGPLFRAFIAPIHFLVMIAFTALVWRGLLTLSEPWPESTGESSLWPQHPLAWPQERPAVSRQPLPWPEQWRAMRRAFFRLAGGALLLIVPPTAILWGSGAGVAIVAAATGLACLWLGLHRGSPLVAQTSDAPPSQQGRHRTANVLPAGYVLPEGQRVPEGYVLPDGDRPAGGEGSAVIPGSSLGRQPAPSTDAAGDQPPYPL